MADLQALDKFNGIIKRLVRFAVSKSPKLDWGGAVKRVSTLLREAELAAISALGPALRNHRDKLMVSDEKFFLTSDLSADIPREFAEYKKDIVGFIEIVKDVYANGCTAQEQKNVIADFKQLLLEYETYVAHS